MVDFQVFVEGGGSTRAEQAPLREAFRLLFKKLNLARYPKIILGGGRYATFQEFANTVANNPEILCLLLVDSEAPVSPGSPWTHVAQRPGDKWQRPSNATDDQLHFMVEAMEAWLAADPEALAVYYGSGFKKNKLPQHLNLEEVPKADLMKALEAATKDAKTKGKYAKSHGFELIGELDPDKVRLRCPGFAPRFFDALETASKEAAAGAKSRRKPR